LLSDVSPVEAAPSFAAHRVVARVGAARLVCVIVFTAFFLLGAAWSLAMPYDGPPDELQHVTRAYGVASGQIYAGQANSNVTTAESLVPRGAGCFRWNTMVSAKCQQTPGANQNAQHTLISVGSGAAGYDPSYYLLVGPVIHIWPTMKGIVIARLITDAEISALLASAAAIAWSGERNRWLLAGIAVCATPVVVSLMGAVNPAGVEIGAAIAFWVSLLDLVGAGPVRRPSVALLLCSGALFAVTRGFGVGWLGATVVICLLGARRERLRAMWRMRRVRLSLAGLGCACAAACVWDLLAGPNIDLTGASMPHKTLRQVVAQELWHRLPSYLDGMVRSTYYYGGDIQVPLLASQIWFGFAGLLVLGGLWLGSRRARIQIAAAIVVPLAILMITDVDAMRQGIFFSQGRYALPLLVGAPLIGAREFGRSSVVSAERSTTLLRLMAVAMLPVQLVVLVSSMLRFQSGYPASGVLPLDPFTGKWLPPLGPLVPIALMILGLVVLGVFMWRPSRFDATMLRFGAVGALVYAIDIAALWVLHAQAGLPLAFATTLAFCCAFAANLALNRIFTFRVSGPMGRQGARLLALSGANYATTLVIVVGFSHLWSEYLVSKTIATAFCAVFNFFAYRRWVFEPVADTPAPSLHASPETGRVIMTRRAVDRPEQAVSLDEQADCR
jgi:putative flippase GtrA